MRCLLRRHLNSSISEPAFECLPNASLKLNNLSGKFFITSGFRLPQKFLRSLHNLLFVRVRRASVGINSSGISHSLQKYKRFTEMFCSSSASSFKTSGWIVAIQSRMVEIS
ncbi:unnamed protein product [Meganyctiphanes norvegica]|uniref:Uncharacterized protein n=1 Tax=Meganyctiphanes norvegica TaxID=48144 RepID=A0AAV2QTN1_MEGNR